MTVRDRAAVLGSPIAHTLSPALHRAAYAALGLHWGYDVIEADGAALAAVLPRMARGRYAGASLTMPLKQVALDLVDDLDPLAARIGAVNTVVFGDDGSRGHNTDVAGVVAALRELGVDVARSSVVVLGAGGAARAVLAALAELQAPGVTVYLRDLSRGTPLVQLGEQLGVGVALEEWSTAEAGAHVADLVVSTTPAGATDALAAGGWRHETALFDLVYAPWPTALAGAAADAGARVVGGLPMLVAQAAEAVRLMTGKEPPVAAMRRAGEEALAAR